MNYLWNSQNFLSFWLGVYYTVDDLHSLVSILGYSSSSLILLQPNMPYPFYNSFQLLPLYVMDNFGHITGLPGLFTASLFSGALRWANKYHSSVVPSGE